MDNNFTGDMQGQTMVDEQPKRKCSPLVCVIVVLLLLLVVWFVIGNRTKNGNTTQALDQQIDSSINSVLSDLQSEDATANASSADLSDIYNLDINK